MEVVRLLEKCGLQPCMASRRRWCSVCGEHSAGQPLFRCIKTLRPLCETCLMEERCFDCYH